MSTPAGHYFSDIEVHLNEADGTWYGSGNCSCGARYAITGRASQDGAVAELGRQHDAHLALLGLARDGAEVSGLVRARTDEPFSGSSGPGRGQLPDEAMASKPNPLGLPDDLRAALDSLGSCIAGSAEDYGQYYRNSWVYGIVLGWDCEEDHEHDDICGGDAAMRELAARHRWSDEDVARLRRYRRAYAQALGR